MNGVSLYLFSALNVKYTLTTAALCCANRKLAFIYSFLFLLLSEILSFSFNRVTEAICQGATSIMVKTVSFFMK